MRINSRDLGANPPKLEIHSDEFTTTSTQTAITNNLALNSVTSLSSDTDTGSPSKGYVFPECDQPESLMAADVNSQTILSPIADAFVRNGTYAGALQISSLIVKSF